MTEQEVYEFYNNTVKVIYSEIEANNKPSSILMQTSG